MVFARRRDDNSACAEVLVSLVKTTTEILTLHVRMTTQRVKLTHYLRVAAAVDRIVTEVLFRECRQMDARANRCRSQPAGREWEGSHRVTDEFGDCCR